MYICVVQMLKAYTRSTHLAGGWDQGKSVWRRKRRHKILFQHPSFPQPRESFGTESTAQSFLSLHELNSHPGFVHHTQNPLPMPIPKPMKKTSSSGFGTFFCLFSSTEATSSAVSFSSRFHFPLTRIERISLLVLIFVGEKDVCVVQYIPVIEFAGWELR